MNPDLHAVKIAQGYTLHESGYGYYPPPGYVMPPPAPFVIEQRPAWEGRAMRIGGWLTFLGFFVLFLQFVFVWLIPMFSRHPSLDGGEVLAWSLVTLLLWSVGIPALFMAINSRTGGKLGTACKVAGAGYAGYKTFS